MPYKVQIFDRDRGISYGDMSVPDQDSETVSAALSHIQNAARLVIENTNPEVDTSKVYAGLIRYELTDSTISS